MIPENLEVWDNFDYGMALENELGVLDQGIVYSFGKIRKFGFMLQISLHLFQLLILAIMIICKHIMLSSTIMQRKCFQRCWAENDQMCTKRWNPHFYLTENVALPC